MKNFLSLIIFSTWLYTAQGQKIITTDIENFWNAYDHIIATQDSARQSAFINTLYLDKASPGLKAMMQVRSYNAQSYLGAINNYPLFWNSIRNNTLQAKSYAKQISRGIEQLRALYPALKPANIYFTIGALRTGGTTLNNMVLIGSELSLADDKTNASEFSAPFQHLPSFFNTNPVKSIVFNNVHEFVHTQQKTTVSNTLLGQCVLEGVAEFLAVMATGQPSTSPALTYGNQHNQRIRAVFSNQMFLDNTGYWLYSNRSNEFGVRDLGYYVGYAICKQYYEQAKDKKHAIKEMIELDYNDAEALEQFADRSGYFEDPLKTIRRHNEANRPKVTGITGLNNFSQSVDPAIKQITIEFDRPMNVMVRGFEFGPLGEKNALKIKGFSGFSADAKRVGFVVELKPGQHYQLLVSERFEDENGNPLTPYLIDFSTQ